MLPDPVGRDAAHDAARRELAKSIYHRQDKSLLQRVVDWVQERLDHVVNKVADTVPTGPTGVVILIIAVALLVLLVVRLVGPVPVRDLLADRSAAERGRSAADERAEAERLAAAGNLDDAVRATTRALVRELEARGVLEPRPGRTPRGIAADAARAVPGVAPDVRVVTDAFEEVFFGERPATLALWQAARDAEARVRAPRLAVTGA